MIRELAENANTYTSLGPGEERVESDRFVIWFGGHEHAAWTVVQRLRLSVDRLDEEIDEIRAMVRSRGRATCTWEVSDSATPPGLVDRLLERGCVPDREPVATGMVLAQPPAGPTAPDVVVRRVVTAEERAVAHRIAGQAFGMKPEDTEKAIAGDQGQLDATQTTYLAYVGGHPVARATASFTPHGALLFGGATLEDARGRGAYRALVAARWDDAVVRGTPVLVTHAGAMSRPILERLGFEPLSTIHILLDETLGAGPVE